MTDRPTEDYTSDDREVLVDGLIEDRIEFDRDLSAALDALAIAGDAITTAVAILERKAGLR